MMRSATVRPEPDNAALKKLNALAPEQLPDEVLRYTLPSRYCDFDKLMTFAWEQFVDAARASARACDQRLAS